MSNILLTVSHLNKSYGDHQAVCDLSFSVERGEIFGLLGPNGAGKSTTISILTGLLPATSGQVTLDGLDVFRSVTAAKARIGYVPQEIALYPSLSAWDNLLFWGRMYGLRGKLLRERVDWALEQVQLTDRARDAIAVYSGGMKRRVNLAAGLLHRPQILFLDEPTVGVDPQSRNAIFESIEALNRAGLTVIYTTHYMEEAERLCKRVAIIDHGKLIALDTATALTRQYGNGMIRLAILDGLVDAVADQTSRLPLVTQVRCSDHSLDIQLQNVQQGLIDVLNVTHTLSAQVTSLEVFDAGLETVFLNLTGKRIRE